MTYKVNVIIEKDDFGYFAYVPELKGCHTQGESFEEVMKNIKEAIELYVETLPPKERKKILSKEILTTSFEVTVG
jgi:predicted RNase H-like HicB family nuclease